MVAVVVVVVALMLDAWDVSAIVAPRVTAVAADVAGCGATTLTVAGVGGTTLCTIADETWCACASACGCFCTSGPNGDGVTSCRCCC